MQISMIANNVLLPFDYSMLRLSTIGVSDKFSSSRVLFIDQDKIIILLTMFDQT